ncbi:hypothetical protein SAMN05428962_2782 [Paenibacillus sp. BC26]|nr:hypothetical protein SAMN05428962_2782 [Paenibacillus sp. BC26]
MKIKRLISMLIVLQLITTACDSKTNSALNSNIKHKNNDVGVQQNKMPNEMPDDFNFLVRFGLGESRKNEINTYNNTVTKDLIIHGTATAKVAFTMEEKRNIYEKMREINIMGTKELIPSLPTDQSCDKTPYNEDSWQISVNGETKTLVWSDKNCEVTIDAKQLLELRTIIRKLVIVKEAYKELPEAEGGYD